MGKLFDILTICNKAGKLCFGFDATVKSVNENKTHLILTASDLSPKTLKELEFKTQNKIRIINIDFDMDTISCYLGKKTGIISINDKGFAKAINR